MTVLSSREALQLIYDWVRDLTVPMHLGLNLRAPFCPVSIHGSHVALLEFQMASRLILLMSSDSKKKELRLHEFISDGRYI